MPPPACGDPATPALAARRGSAGEREQAPRVVDGVASRLARLLGVAIDAGDADDVWDRLDRWAGRENLEERMVERRRIDRTVLRTLRERDEAAARDRAGGR